MLIYSSTISAQLVDDYQSMIRLGWGDYPSYLASGYYSVWEAEADHYYNTNLRLRHTNENGKPIGRIDTLDGKVCWSTGTEKPPLKSLICGPNYKQDKKFNLWWDNNDIVYTADFSLALDKATLNDTINIIPVVRLSIIYNYKLKESGKYLYRDTLNSKIIYSDQFKKDNFNSFTVLYAYYDKKINGKWYSRLTNDYDYGKREFIDECEGCGVEFVMDWFGGNKLYLDKVEVYDRKIPFMINYELDHYKNAISESIRSYEEITGNRYYLTFKHPETIDRYFMIYRTSEEVSKLGREVIIPEEMLVDQSYKTVLLKQYDETED